MPFIMKRGGHRGAVVVPMEDVVPAGLVVCGNVVIGRVVAVVIIEVGGRGVIVVPIITDCGKHEGGIWGVQRPFVLQVRTGKPERMYPALQEKRH